VRASVGSNVGEMIHGLTEAILPRPTGPTMAKNWSIRGRVLLVEDGPDNQALMGHFLRQSGAVVDVAANGLEALEKAAEARPDAVVMDIVMPHMDGFEAAKRLRQSHGRSIFLVALTGWDGEKDRERTREAGFDAHLVKPVELDSLRRLFSGLRTSAPAHTGAC
ncbi:MAG TPA: response regulator, partial [Usitatibacter sp.]|nr:response regulator [Usitatibacter sp.]